MTKQEIEEADAGYSRLPGAAEDARTSAAHARALNSNLECEGMTLNEIEEYSQRKLLIEEMQLEAYRLMEASKRADGTPSMSVQAIANRDLAYSIARWASQISNFSGGSQ